MKKVLLLLALCVVIVAVFASCGETETTTAKPTTTSDQTPVTTIDEVPTTTEAPETTTTGSATVKPTTDEFGNVSTDLVESGYVENGLTYDIYKDGAKLIAVDATATEVTVPAKIKDGTVDVKFVASHLFKHNETVTKIALENGITVLGKEVFYGCFNLKEITLSNTITTIGDGLFRNCYALEKVILPDTITSMGTDVFYECRSLKEVALPNNESFVIVPSETFYNCKSLKTIALPDSTTVIGEKAFYYCTSLESFTFSKKIDAIGAKAFYNCASLTTVDLSASAVTSVPNYAFYKCSALTSLKLADNTKSIGAYAFYGCESLDAINVPASVSSISTGAFAYCTKIKTITIPEAIKTISARVFYKCSALETINMAKDITTIGEAAFAYTALKSFEVPASVTELAKGAFSYCASLASVTFAKDFAMTEFSANLFAYCTALKAIEIPESVTIINNGAFHTCTALETVKLSSQTTQLAQNSFVNCAAIKEVTLPDSITTIGRNAIGVSLIDSVATPNKDTKFYAFESGAVGKFFNNAGVTFTSLGISGYVPFADLEVKPIDGKTGEYELVKYTGSLTEVAINETYKDGKITKIAANFMKDNKTVVSVKLPDAIKEIGASAFEGCTSLTSVNIPTGVTTIADKTFKDTAITELLPNTAAKALTKIGASAFEGCSALKNIKIDSASKLEVLGDRAFAGTAITAFNAPRTLTTIGNSAFEGCTKLLYVDMKGPAPTIGTDVLKNTTPLAAFHYLSGETSFVVTDGIWNGYPATIAKTTDPFITFELKASDAADAAVVATAKILYNGDLNIAGADAKSVIPDFASADATPWAAYAPYITSITVSKVQRVGNYTFAGLANINTFALPSSGLLEIGEYAFKDMTSLTALTIPATVTKIGKGAFIGTAVTSAKFDKITVIPEDLFLNVTTLTEVTLSAKTTEIGARAFMNTSITGKITISSTVTSVGEEAFKNCVYLEEVTSSAAKIGASAFEGCSALKAVTLAGLTEIGDAAFKGIVIEKVSLPKEVTAIGNEAFADCAQLAEITLLGSAPTIGTDVLKNTPIYAHFFYSGSDTSYQLTDGKWNGYLATSDVSKPMATFSVDNGKVTVTISYKGVLAVTVNQEGGVIPNYTSADETPWAAYKNFVTSAQFNTVAAIGDYAFEGFVKLSDVKFTAKTTSIGKRTFANCAVITSLNTYATSIGEEAFAGCKKISSAELSRVTDFGYRAFGDCLSLTTVNISSSLGLVSASAANAFENTPYGAL